jgi:hypothetical protein
LYLTFSEMLIKLAQVNYLSSDYQGFLTNLLELLTIAHKLLPVIELFDKHAFVGVAKIGFIVF